MTDVDVTETTSTTPAATIDEPAATVSNASEGTATAGLGTRIGRIPVTNVSPVIEGGAYAAKAVVGESIRDPGDRVPEGHDAVNASVMLTDPGGNERASSRWSPPPRSASTGGTTYVSPGDREGAWTFRVEGWSDPWETWVHNAEIKIPAGIDVPLVCPRASPVPRPRPSAPRQAGDHPRRAFCAAPPTGLASPSRLRTACAIVLHRRVRQR